MPLIPHDRAAEDATIASMQERLKTQQPHESTFAQHGLLWLLIALWVVLYGSFTLLRPPLLDDADSVHAEVAREMVARHDWITLYANGIRYLEKAPLLYWSMAASFRCFGVHTWAARLPLALYTLLLLLVVYALGRRCFADALAGFYASLVLATSFGLFIFTRILIPDAMVCLWLALAMLCFWRSLAQPTRANAAGFAVACALGVLTKGLIGLVFPLLIVAVYLAMTRNLAHLRRWHPLLGTLIFFAITAPWHVAAGLANPTEGHPGTLPTPGNVHGFYWFYFVNEHLLRYLNRRVPRDYDTVPLGLFWGLLVVWLLPWSAFLPSALCRVPLRRWWRGASLNETERARLLLFCWAAVPMVFFSFSTRQEYYVLPAMPALALLVGGWLAEDAGAGDARAAADSVAALCRRRVWRGYCRVLRTPREFSKRRPGFRPEQQSRRLRALVRALPRPEHAGNGLLPRAAAVDGGGSARWHRWTSAAAAGRASAGRDWHAGWRRRAVPGCGAHGAGDVLPRAFIGDAGGGNPSAAGAGRCDCAERRIRERVDAGVLPAAAGANPQRPQLESLVRFVLLRFTGNL